MASTVKEQHINQIEVMKSKFIAYLLPLDDEEDFKPILATLRKEHKKARHIVYAYRVGMKSKSCDDGEPKGTAGHPLLDLLYKKGIGSRPNIYLDHPPKGKHDLEILSYCFNKEHSIKEITNHLGLSDSNYFRKNVIKRLVNDQLLLESSNSRRKCYLTNQQKVFVK